MTDAWGLVLRGRIIRLWAAVGVLALLAAGCADGDSGGEPSPPPVTAAPETSQSTSVVTSTSTPDPCDVPLRATDVGISAEEITVFVMADVSTPLAPDLFAGAMDAVKAWGEAVNDRGGLACRKVVVKEWDSRLAPDSTMDGTRDACDHAFAMVGTTSLVLLDATNLATCRDLARLRTGVPDIAQLATELPHQCNPTTFPIDSPKATCPYAGGPRASTQFVGASRYFVARVPGLHGVSLVPNDRPSVTQSSIAAVRAQQVIGVVDDGTFAVSVRDDSTAYARVLQTVKEKGSTIVYSAAGADVMVRMRKEAAAQGAPSVTIWACSLSCYTQEFLDSGGADVEGTYVWLQFLPFEEADANAQLKAYLDAVGGLDDADPWGAGAWAAAIEFEQVVEAIVEREGPNGLTRARVLAELAALPTFDADGWFGAKPQRELSSCYVLLQVRNGRFVRVFPEQRGTLHCDPQNLQEVTVDPAAELQG